MGREKIKVYEYTSKGKFIKAYNSESDLRKVYYKDYIGKFPLWNVDSNIHFLVNTNIVLKERKGRDWIIKELRKIFDPYKIRPNKRDNGVIEVYNENKELIARFANVHLASKLLNIATTDIWYGINHSKGEKTKKGLYFKKVKGKE